MNTFGINKGPINGTNVAQWVVLASAMAGASATSSGNATQYVKGTAFGDASVEITLLGKHTVAGKAQSQVSTSSALDPITIYAGTAFTTTGAFGTAAVLRSVSAQSSADGLASGEAITASALGYVDTLVSVNGSAEPHVIFPGKVTIWSIGTGTGDAIPIRMSPVLGDATTTGFGEASIQKSGDNFLLLDGFSRTQGTSSGFVRNDYTATIATEGGFAFGTSTGTGECTTRFQAKTGVIALGLRVQAAGTKTTFSFAESATETTSQVAPKNTKKANSLGIGEAVGYAPKARIHHKGFVLGEVGAVSTAQSNISWAARALSIAGSTSFSVNPAEHFFNNTSDTVSASGIGKANLTNAGHVLVHAVVSSNVVAVRYLSSGALGTLNVTGTAFGFSNVDSAAPASRTMVVLNDPRSMRVSYEDRSMKVGV